MSLTITKSLSKQSILPTLSSSSVKPTVSKEKQIQEIFATKSPKIILDTLHTKGYTSLDECHCCPQFSRSKNKPKGNPDIRGDIIEKTFVEMICLEHPDKEKSITICSLGAGCGFEDLLVLSKLGYKNVSWILVDPTYSGKNGTHTPKQGQKILNQFTEIAKILCPGIKIQIIDFLTELYTTKLISAPDVVFDFDDGLLGATSFEDYLELQKGLCTWIDSTKKPVLFLHTKKLLKKVTFNQKKQCLQQWVQTTVDLSTIAPTKKPEKITLSDSTIPEDLSPSAPISVDAYFYILLSDDYEGVSFCLDHGTDPNQKYSDGYIALMTMAEKGFMNSLKALVEQGIADVNKSGHGGLTPLHTAVSAKSHPIKVIDYLIAHGARINHCDDDGFTPLMCAAEHGYIDSLCALLAHKADLKSKNIHGHTAYDLFLAFRTENPEAYPDTIYKDILSLLKPTETPVAQEKPKIEINSG